MVHRRELDGQELVLGNQGDLFGNAMTWWDHDTGSVWSQPRGEAILGPLAGERLELIASTLTPWGSWRDAHPDTLALDAPGGSSGFSLERTVIVVEIGTEAIAYPYEAVVEAGVVNDSIAGVEIAVLVDPAEPTRWAVFSRRLDDTVVELEVREGTLVDAVTGSEFDAVRGFGRAGALRGQNLDMVPAFPSFARDFGTFFPSGEIWSRA